MIPEAMRPPLPGRIRPEMFPKTATATKAKPTRRSKVSQLDLLVAAACTLVKQMRIQLRRKFALLSGELYLANQSFVSVCVKAVRCRRGDIAVGIVFPDQLLQIAHRIS